MQELYEKIQEYLNMDEEISFEEFSGYYKSVVDTLSNVDKNLSEEEVWQALFIIENLMSNAESRAKGSKGAQAKKYNKIAERTTLWAKNLSNRLHEKGYTEEQINERFEKMLEEGSVQAN